MNIVDLAILKKMVSGGGGSGTDNYNDLLNLPQINGETLAGNKTAENLGLQDALTFDSTPTEDSTNPVESGGVYSELAKKQDNLTFDGTYDASTNKAATESTVTNAINELDVSATSFDADETISSISETDGKLSVTKQNIAIASNQVVAMTGYAKPSSAPANPAVQTNDTANQAIGKLEYKVDTNQTNILSVWNATEELVDNGAKNMLDFERWSSTIGVTHGTKSVSGNTITLTSDGSQCYTEPSAAGGFPIDMLPVEAGKTYVFSWTSDSPSAVKGAVNIFPNGSATGSVEADNTIGKLEYTVPSGVTYVTFRLVVSAASPAYTLSFSDLMFTTKAEYDVSPAYEPHALGNQYLTPVLVEVVNKSAKNVWDFANAIYNRSQGSHTKTDESITVTSNNNTWQYMSYVIPIKAGKYVYRCKISDFTNTGGVNTAIITFTSDVAGQTTISQIAISDNNTYTVTFSIPTDTTIYIFYFASTNTAGTTTFKASENMICTLADWNVSQNFEPFALPNTDLTRMMTPFFTVPINHNMIYRGQNLGDTLTEAQDTALSSGNFTDLYLGDYWTKTVTIPAFYELTTAEPADWSTNYTSYYTKSGDTYTPVSGDTAPTWAANTYYERLVPAQTVTLKAVIADFDTFYAGYSNYSAINTHHAAVIVTGFNNVVWNKTNTTAGGYVNSLIHKWLVGSALPQIETWFGSAKVLSHQKYLTNAITGDAASGCEWSLQKISLLSENQMYGSKVCGNSNATSGCEPGEAFKHLNVFNHIDANLLFGNKSIWLREITSATWSASLYGSGRAGDNGASNSGVAPAALILLS